MVNMEEMLTCDTDKLNEISKTTEKDDIPELIELLMQANSMVEVVSDTLPVIKPAINAILNSSFIEFLKLLGITAVFYIVFIIIGNKLYFRGAVGNLSSGAKKGKNITGKDIKINSVRKIICKKRI